jgi:hypothetical protein
LIQALLVDGPQLKTHRERPVILKLHILQNPQQTASLPQTAPQDCRTSVEDPQRKAGNTKVTHPSKPPTDSFPSTNSTAGLPTEEELCDIKL